MGHAHEGLVALDDGHVEDGARVQRDLHLLLVLLVLAIWRERNAVLVLILRAQKL